jgi:hypothetical protein
LSVKLVKFVVFATKDVKPEAVIDDILNDGTDSKEKQLRNILAILVTDNVLNKGTDFKDIQSSNIEVIVVTETVLNKGTDFKG